MPVDWFHCSYTSFRIILAQTNSDDRVTAFKIFFIFYAIEDHKRGTDGIIARALIGPLMC